MENNIDKLFKSKFDNEQIDFNAHAWDKMSSLMDEEETTGSAPESKKRKRKGFFLMFFAGMIILSLGYVFMPENEEPESKISIAKNSKDNTFNRKATPIHKGDDNTSEKVSSDAQPNNYTTNIQEKETRTELRRESDKEINKELNKNYRTESNQSLPVSSQRTTNENANKIQKSNSVKTKSRIVINDKKTTYEPLTNEVDLDKKPLNKFKKMEEEYASRAGVKMNLSQSSVELDEFLTKEGDSIDADNNVSYSTTRKEDVIEKRDLFDFNRLAILDIEKLVINQERNISIPIITLLSDSRFLISLYAQMGVSDRLVLQMGSRLSYRINNELSISTGLIYEMDKQDNSKIFVEEKIYSFGSTLVNRSFQTDKRQSINVPFRFSRSFNKFSLLGGLTFQYNLLTRGSMLEGQELGDFFNVENENVKKININYSIGGAYQISRMLSIHGGVEYRPSFVKKSTLGTNSSYVTPYIGINYSLIKF